MTGVKPAGRMKELADIRASKGELLPLLKEQMLLGMDQDDRDTTGLHVSDLVHPDTCHRLVSARMLELDIPEERFVFSRQNVFDEGDRIHKKWQQRMRGTGKLWGRWECRICKVKSALGFEPKPLDYGPCLAVLLEHIWRYKEIPFEWEPLLLQGHADGGMGSAIIEIKSVGTGTLRFEAPRILAENTIRQNGREFTDLNGIWNAIRRPFPAHIRQANMYCWLASQLGMKFDHIVFLYEAKWHQQVKEWTIQPSSLIIEPMLEAAETISSAVRAGKLAPCQSESCKQCEGIDADSPVNLGVADWPREPDGSYSPDSAGYQPVYLGAPAGTGTTPDPAEPPGHSGSGTDGLVPGNQRMGEIPAVTAGNGGGRRIRRPASDEQSGSSGASKIGRENGDRNESSRPGRRVVRRRS